jgi:hypothetical protein
MHQRLFFILLSCVNAVLRVHAVLQDYIGKWEQLVTFKLFHFEYFCCYYILSLNLLGNTTTAFMRNRDELKAVCHNVKILQLIQQKGWCILLVFIDINIKVKSERTWPIYSREPICIHSITLYNRSAHLAVKGRLRRDDSWLWMTAESGK